MPRYRTPPVTLEELAQPGPFVRVRDIMAITGWNRATVLACIDTGELTVVRRTVGHKACYFFTRENVLEWLHGMSVPRFTHR